MMNGSTFVTENSEIYNIDKYINMSKKGYLFGIQNFSVVIVTKNPEIKKILNYNNENITVIVIPSDLFFTKKVPKWIKTVKEPTLNDGWLSGFTDAEGCFSVKIGNEKASFYVSLLFILDQKNEEKVLNKIASLFTINKKAILRTPNKTRVNNKWNMFRLTFYCNDKKKVISSKLINYFTIYLSNFQTKIW